MFKKNNSGEFFEKAKKHYQEDQLSLNPDLQEILIQKLDFIGCALLAIAEKMPNSCDKKRKKKV